MTVLCAITFWTLVPGCTWQPRGQVHLCSDVVVTKRSCLAPHLGLKTILNSVSSCKSCAKYGRNPNTGRDGPRTFLPVLLYLCASSWHAVCTGSIGCKHHHTAVTPRRKGLAAAIWRPELNVAEVVTTGRKQLYFQGAAASGPKQHTAIHLLDICCGPSLHACLAVH